MPNTAPQRHRKCVSETRLVGIDMRGLLESGELLTGTPTVAEVTSTDLTLSSKQVNSGTIVVNGATCVAGQAVRFLVAGGVAGETYTIRVTVSSNGTPAQTFVVSVLLDVVED